MRPLTRGGEITIESFLSDTDERSLANDVLDGLTRPFKEIPAKQLHQPILKNVHGGFQP
jgi:L-histidine Nalpha-methyltransferase